MTVSASPYTGGPGDGAGDADLQQIVDALAERLRRSVAIDDPRLRLLAASRHFGDEDPARVHAMLSREATPANTEWVLSHGVASWHGPGRIQARPESGAAGRVCVPVRCHGALFGYLWLIDPDKAVTEDQLAAAQQAAEHAGAVLDGQLRFQRRRRQMEGALVSDLLGDDAAARARAREALLSGGFPAAQGCVAVLVVEVLPVPGAEVPDAATADLERALRAAVEPAALRVPGGSVLGLFRGGHAVLLLTAATQWHEGALTDVAGRLTRSVGAVVGVGSVHHDLDDSLESYRHALDAVRAARLLPDLGPVVLWDRLGAYAVLLQLLPERVSREHYPAPVARLLAADRSRRLVTTVETYLDHAGDSQLTAQALGIHRTTLYYRLGRVEEIGGISLRDGGDRLTVHLGVKLARLSGDLPPAPLPPS
ncbi:helix-turn-helix domain-containing protein [Streptomyces sp. NBC_01474]|uniref:PucR family transcriptional regulator n=1 Tax=unclassified Streptomyces TaxID=2593676 RepID=UPI002DDC31CB|nr:MULTISPECIES: helix-turn-helix domain-containing protein [unclassified Streptomyces]WSD94733.1 helix-turn-helix domain-containing protein [Streptomyces sp. NBC_01474]